MKGGWLTVGDFLRRGEAWKKSNCLAKKFSQMLEGYSKEESGEPWNNISFPDRLYSLATIAAYLTVSCMLQQAFTVAQGIKFSLVFSVFLHPCALFSLLLPPRKVVLPCGSSTLTELSLLINNDHCTTAGLQKQMIWADALCCRERTKLALSLLTFNGSVM